VRGAAAGRASAGRGGALTLPPRPPSRRTDYYIPYALSGQQTDLPAGTLSFAPLYACPLALPFGIAGGEGTLSCDAGGQWTLALAFGNLTLPAGGLSAGGRAYAGAVALGKGGSVSW